MSRYLLHAAAILGLLIGAAAVADALVITDEERIGELLEALDGPVDARAIDTALRFVETDRQPLELVVQGSAIVYDDADAELARRARTMLRPLLESDTELIQHAIEVEGEEARVTSRTRTRYGVVDATVDLAKHGDRWLIRRARLR